MSAQPDKEKRFTLSRRTFLGLSAALLGTISILPWRKWLYKKNSYNIRMRFSHSRCLPGDLVKLHLLPPTQTLADSTNNDLPSRLHLARIRGKKLEILSSFALPKRLHKSKNGRQKNAIEIRIPYVPAEAGRESFQLVAVTSRRPFAALYTENMQHDLRFGTSPHIRSVAAHRFERVSNEIEVISRPYYFGV